MSYENAFRQRSKTAWIEKGIPWKSAQLWGVDPNAGKTPSGPVTLRLLLSFVPHRRISRADDGQPFLRGRLFEPGRTLSGKTPLPGT